MDILPNPPDSLPVWDVSFHPSEEVTLEITYQAAPSGGCDGRHCGSEMTYFAASAQLWAGVVESAEIRFTFGRIASVLAACIPNYEECLGLEASPPGHVVRTWGVRWNLTDWEPDHDFKVSIDWIEPQ